MNPEPTSADVTTDGSPDLAARTLELIGEAGAGLCDGDACWLPPADPADGDGRAEG